MEELNETRKVIPELYFLIAKFLSGGPLKETTKTLLKELEEADVLPRRLDWEGREHRQSYEELASKFSEVSWPRLAEVCVRALELARLAGAGPNSGLAAVQPAAECPAITDKPASDKPLSESVEKPIVLDSLRVTAKLSLLSDGLVRERPKYASYKRDHSLVRRLTSRETGSDLSNAAGGCGGSALFPPRLLSGLALQRRTLGHLSAVYCLAFDPTGHYVVTGADDLLIKIWSAVDGRLLATLRGAGAEITDICITQDGRLLACGSVDKLVRVWELEGGSPTAVLSAHQGTITAVHWAPLARDDLRWLATTSTDGSVAFWTCTLDGSFSSSPVQYVERMRPGVCHMICGAWSSGGAFLAAGSADHHVRIYAVQLDDIQSPRRVVETAVHSEAVDSLSWAHHSLRFVSGSKDGTAALWYLHAAHWRHVMLRVASADVNKKLKVTMVCWDRSDAFVLTAVSDCTIRVWCSSSCAQVASLAGHKDEVYVLEAHPRLPGVVLSAGHDGQVLLWQLPGHQPIAKFHNHIAGQGDGAIFDAKWGGPTTLAATDSHGHLLLLGLGAGHPLLHDLPMELFFHTDYRPLVRDALGGALDEQTETPPHLLPPGLLVDVEGCPYPPHVQRHAPTVSHYTGQTGRSQLDEMIEALAAGRADNDNNANREERAGWGGVWRGGGVRHAGGGGYSPHTQPRTSPIIPRRHCTTSCSMELNAWEQQQYRREMRRRPVMISTGSQRPPRAKPRAPRRKPPAAHQPTVRLVRLEDELPASASSNDTSDEDSAQDESHQSDSADYSSHSMSKSDDDNSESSYSDWEAGNAALAPPARVRRKPQPAKRYSPTISAIKRANRTAAASSAEPESPAEPGPSQAPAPAELPDLYRVGDWLTSVTPRKAPYIPQMGDVCLYFKLGHQRYFEAVSEKDLYKVSPKDKPWESMHIYDCELVKVTGIKYELRPPRLACLRVAGVLDGRGGFTLRYHDMPDVIDFLVLKEHAERPVAADKFRCMIDDSWWSGSVTARAASPPRAPASNPAEAFSNAMAHKFLSLTVQWDNGELERLSPWDLEPQPAHRMPSRPGGAVPVLPHELEEIVLRSIPSDSTWGRASKRLGELVSQVMSLSAAEPFVAPVDLQQYPNYALVVAYPIDLSTIRARFNNLFYRRAAAAQFDARYLAYNAEMFNHPHSLIVKQARLLTDLLLTCIAEWQTIDVVSKYHELAAAYRSSDEEPLANCKRSRATARKPTRWLAPVRNILRQLMSSADAAPFLQPVDVVEAPDYGLVVSEPMDLGTVQQRLDGGHYSKPQQFYNDVRLMFTNSRLYNTNKRTRIYSMTVRLQALFETLWVQVPCGPRGQRRTRRQFQTLVTTNGLTRQSSSSESDAGPRAPSDPLALPAPADEPKLAPGKGKGVGKKSTRISSPVSSPQPCTSRRTRDRSKSASSSSSWSDDVPLHSHRLEHLSDESPQRTSRRRKISSDSDASARKPRSRHRRKKIRRERVIEPSSSSCTSSSAAPEDDGRYESDRSYRPASSDDEDKPLTVYRQQKQLAGASAGGPSSSASGPGPSSSSARKHARLRRREPQRYNEDSDDGGASAISRRARHHRTPTHLLTANIRNASFADHDYVNGHAAAAPPPAGAPGTLPVEDPVSISSRGRVRKLTAKARGLLRE